MTERCPSAFDGTLLTGFLDHELTQADEQRVRIHTEDCAHCRAVLTELRTIREATMTTRVAEPPDSQWDERAQGGVARTARGLGWILAVAWLVLVTGFGLWAAWTAPQSAFERVLVFGGISAFALLLGSVLMDRLRAARSDRYREVKR